MKDSVDIDGLVGLRVKTPATPVANDLRALFEAEYKETMLATFPQ